MQVSQNAPTLKSIQANGVWKRLPDSDNGEFHSLANLQRFLQSTGHNQKSQDPKSTLC